MVAAGRGIHREELVPDPEGRLTPGLHLVRLGQCQAQPAETGQRRRRHGYAWRSACSGCARIHWATNQQVGTTWSPSARAQASPASTRRPATPWPRSAGRHVGAVEVHHALTGGRVRHDRRTRRQLGGKAMSRRVVNDLHDSSIGRRPANRPGSRSWDCPSGEGTLPRWQSGLGAANLRLLTGIRLESDSVRRTSCGASCVWSGTGSRGGGAGAGGGAALSGRRPGRCGPVRGRRRARVVGQPLARRAPRELGRRRREPRARNGSLSLPGRLGVDHPAGHRTERIPDQPGRAHHRRRGRSRSRHVRAQPGPHPRHHRLRPDAAGLRAGAARVLPRPRRRECRRQPRLGPTASPSSTSSMAHSRP